MKILMGNVVFGLLILGWFFWFRDQQQVMIAGTVLAFAAFAAGAVVGGVLATRSPRPRTMPTLRRRARRAQVDASVFEQIS